MGRKQGIMSLSAALGGLALLMLLCPYASKAYAEELQTRSTGASSIAVALVPTMDLELLPTTSGTLGKQVVDFVVNTKNTTGFRVLLHSDSTVLKNNNHVETIASITATTKLANLPTNTWGVYFGATAPNNNSNFAPISTKPTEVAHNDLANASGTYKLAIGVKADTSLPAGMYSNNLVISVVASAPEVTSLDNATYMQEVTPEICANTKIWESEEDSVYLVDKRDDKTYKVARLKDGNCWMQESLRLTLSKNTPLTSEDSDVEESWTPSDDTYTTMINDMNYTNGKKSWKFSTAVGEQWYYQFNAATAGSGEYATVDGAEAQWSICPKGWKLPLAGPMNNNESGSFEYLKAAYIPAGTALTPFYAPFNAVYSGRVIPNGAADQAGSMGMYWSRVSEVAADAYALMIYKGVPNVTSASIDTSYQYSTNRASGFSIRCVIVAP